MGKVCDILEMWQSRQNPPATPRESLVHIKQMTAIKYISDTEQIVKASWSLVQHDGVAGFKSSERSPFSAGLSAMDIPAGQTQILNVHRIRRIYHHPVKSNENSAPECKLDTENWPNSNKDMDDPNDREVDRMADIESDIERDNGIDDREGAEQRDVSASPNIPGLCQPTQKSKGLAETVLLTVKAKEMRRNTGIKTK